MQAAAVAKGALHAFGYYRHRLAGQPYEGVAVLAYHGVRDDRRPAGSMCFEALHVRTSTLHAHCCCLRDLGCSVLTLADWDQIVARARPLPPRAVMLTFDDGYRTVLTHGLPVLEQYRFPATVFACSGPIERQVRFWFDAIGARDGEDAVARATQLDHRSWRALIDGAETAVHSDDPHAPLTVDELQRLAGHPLVTVGAHSVWHPILAQADVQTQREEVGRSRVTIEAWTGRPVTAFAYPNGGPGDFTAETMEIVGACGMQHAFGTGNALAHPSAAARFEQPRFVMLDTVTGAELAHRLALAWPRIETR